MKKQILFLSITLFLSIDIFGSPIDSIQARVIAQQFYAHKNKFRSNAELTLSHVEKRVQTRSSMKVFVYYYVFNSIADNGFVLVSGDDNFSPIIAYSLEGKFTHKKLPNNIAYWMDEFKKAIDKSAKLYSPKNANKLLNQKASSSRSVSPLLGRVIWNQGSPYNLFTPTVNDSATVVGCVATAMAQIMKYHEWPLQGQGAHTYTSKTRSLESAANFGETTYDWTNMTDTYSDESTDVQKNAVATLSHHCGVAVEMDYNTSQNGGSGAYSQDVPKALFTYFGYDNIGIQQYRRELYNKNEWINMIKAELDAKRPIYYSGQSVGGGHAFVCDGYDENDYFHINWGWGGMANGYYNISVLEPGQQGIGGGEGAFRYGQAMIAGIREPAEGIKKAPFQLAFFEDLTMKSDSIARDEGFMLTMKKMWNMGCANYSGQQLALGMYHGNELIERLLSYKIGVLGQFYGYREFSFETTMPSTIAPGEYTLYPIFKNDDDTWSKVLSPINLKNQIAATVRSDSVFFSYPSQSPNLTLVENPEIVGNIYNNASARINVTITNTGKEFNAKVGLRITSVEKPEKQKKIVSHIVNIPQNETVKLELTPQINVDKTGDYYLEVLYDNQNNLESKSYPATVMLPEKHNRIRVSIVAESTQAAKFSLSEFSVPAKIELGKTFTVTGNLSNTGGFFDGNIIGFIFPETQGKSLGYFNYKPLIIDKDESLRLSLSGAIEALDAGTYRIALFYKEPRLGKGWTQLSKASKFRLLTSVTAIENILEKKDQLQVYPNPTSDIISIKSQYEILDVSIMNLTGSVLKQFRNRPQKNFLKMDVTSLLKGNYILQIKTRKGTQVTKFIKK